MKPSIFSAIYFSDTTFSALSIYHPIAHHMDKIWVCTVSQ